MTAPAAASNRVVQGSWMVRSAALVCAACARRVHQDVPHHLRRHRKKLRALVPFDLGHVYQAEVYLMHQCCGLESIGLALIFHIPARHEAQFGIYPLRQPCQRSFVAAAQAFNRLVISTEDAPMDTPFSSWIKNIPRRGRFWRPLPPVPAEGEQALRMISSKKIGGCP